MSEIKHVSEPWVACDHDMQTSGDSPKRRIRGQCMVGLIGGFEREREALRAVQCVNALAGIPDPLRDLETARQSLRNAIAQIPGDINGMAHVRAALDLLTGKA